MTMPEYLYHCFSCDKDYTAWRAPKLRHDAPCPHCKEQGVLKLQPFRRAWKCDSGGQQLGGKHG